MPPENASPRRSVPDIPWALPWEELAEVLEVSTKEGLSDSEAEERRVQYGPNRIRGPERKGLWRILLSQFKSLIIGLLAVASAVSFAFGRHLEGVAIGVALVINAVIGFVTEWRAARSVEALRELGKTTAKTLRSGAVSRVVSENLVPGDVVLLEAGDLVPADLRLIEANNLRADESALTGESVPRTKSIEPVAPNANLAERDSMVFKGTAVVGGSGAGIVAATGTDTELGDIAALTEEAEGGETPLEERLAHLGRMLVWGTAGVAVVVAVAGLLGGKPWLVVVETAIAMAVAAVPEGLPIVATIALARGVWRMARRNALVNRLSAVETLGATSVICTDKTGTLTENRMSLEILRLPSGIVRLDQESEEESDGGPLLRSALEIGVLCNNASFDPDAAAKDAVGDPMEIALLKAGVGHGLTRNKLLDEQPEEREEAFDADTKMMATYHKTHDGFRVAVKGAPEAVLAACSSIASEEGDAGFSDEAREEWLQGNMELAEDGYRVLAVAEKTVSSADDPPYQELRFVGLLGLVDPPRREIKEVLATCRRAGIFVVMVTGDQAVTARNVARQVELAEGEVEVLEGAALEDADQLSDEEAEPFLRAQVFARVSPKQKLRLIELHQRDGNVVAMTGDGINDAPALKKADIGVAMGKRGTQVAREAADMVLKDDRFATIVGAVEYGRIIFDNIRTFIVYLLSGNVSEVLVVSLVGLTPAPLPLLPLQILYINLIGDIFPALALGVGRGDPAVMERSPRDPKEPVLTRRHWLAVVGFSAVIAAAVIAAFTVALGPMNLGAERAVTVSFLTLIFGRLWHLYNMRAPGSGWLRNEVVQNPFVWGAVAIGIFLALIAVYIPALAAVLGVVPPRPREWCLILGMSVAPLVVVQGFHLLRQRLPRIGP